MKNHRYITKVNQIIFYGTPAEALKKASDWLFQNKDIRVWDIVTTILPFVDPGKAFVNIYYRNAAE